MKYWKQNVNLSSIIQRKVLFFPPTVNSLFFWSSPNNGRHRKQQKSAKEIVKPKMKILSNITHPHALLNLYGFLFSVQHKRRNSENCAGQSFLLNYNEWGLKLSSYKKTRYCFGRYWFSNDMRVRNILIFCWTIPLMRSCQTFQEFAGISIIKIGIKTTSLSSRLSIH